MKRRTFLEIILGSASTAYAQEKFGLTPKEDDTPEVKAMRALAKIIQDGSGEKDLEKATPEMLKALDAYNKQKFNGEPMVLMFPTKPAEADGKQECVVFFYDPKYRSKRTNDSTEEKTYPMLSGRLGAFRNVEVEKDLTMDLQGHHRAGLILYGKKGLDSDYEYGECEGYVEYPYKQRMQSK